MIALEQRNTKTPCAGCATAALYRFDCRKCFKLFCSKCLVHEPGGDLCVDCEDSKDQKIYKVEIQGVEAFIDPKTTPQGGGFTVKWLAEGVGTGTGELSVFFKDSRWSMDTENMSNRFADAVFLALRKWLVRCG